MNPKPENERYITEADFNRNLQMRMQILPYLLAMIRRFKVTEDKMISLDFFFYTNTADKAQQLVTALKALSYYVKPYTFDEEEKTYEVTGWTNKMELTDDVIQAWVQQMSELGYKYDCEFDGWGTYPNQE